MIKTPAFWYDTENKAARLATKVLTPFSYIYDAGRHMHRNKVEPYKSSIPVVCVGNIVAGGSGKTPVAIAVANLLRGRNPVFLMRGYGGNLKAPTVVRDSDHTADHVGDEALMLHHRGKVIIAEDRAAGAKLAEEQGAELIIMDDGLQNPSLDKTVKLVVIAGETGFGNRRMLPAGPLRVPLEEGLTNADAFILLNEDKTDCAALLPADKPLFRASLQIADSWTPRQSESYVAFCGTGQPEKFRRSLLEIGVTIASWQPFPDHHKYTAGDLERLRILAQRHGARLVTTEKDAVKLPSSFSCDVAPAEIVWENEEEITQFLRSRIAADFA